MMTSRDMKRSACTATVLFLLLVSWWCTLVRPSLEPLEVITASVQVSLIQPHATPVNTSFKDPPRRPGGVRRHPSVPQFMLDLYRTGTPTDVVRSLTPRRMASLLPHREMIEERRTLLVFDIPKSSPAEVLQTAELKLPPTKSTDGEWSVRVSLVLQSGLLELHFNNVDHNWLNINVTSMARSTPTTLTFVVSTRETQDTTNGQSLQPLLLLSYKTASKGRSPGSRLKRSPSSDPEEYEEETNNVWDDDTMMTSQGAGVTTRKTKRLHRNTCRRRPLYVDFSEIHYDSWIIAPNGYEAFQCVGKCFFPVSEHLSPTKHAIVQTLLHSVTPSKTARACCVPTRLEPISVLYMDHRGVLTYRFSYHDMVVAECGCR